MKRKKYATGTSVKNYMENPYVELQQNQINKIKAESEAANNPWTKGLGVAGNLLMQYGISQGGFGETGLGQFANSALPILGNMQFAHGGKVPVEVEGDEVAETPQGQLMEFKGPGHEEGGIDTSLEPGTEIFSDRIKVKGKTMANRKKGRERKRHTLESLLGKNPTDVLTKNALKRTQETNTIQEQFDMNVQDIVSKIEQLQGFANGGTVDPPTKRAKLLERLQSLNIAKDHTPESFQNLQETDVQAFLNQMFDENPNIQRPQEAQATLAKLMSQEGAEAKIISKTKFQIADDPVTEVITPGKTRDEIFAETRKKLKEQGLDPDTGSFEFKGKMYNTKLVPDGGSSKDRLPDTIEQSGSNEILDADKYFDQKEFANGGIVDWLKGLFNKEPKIDFSNVEGTTSRTGADPMIAGDYADDFSDPSIGSVTPGAGNNILDGLDFSDPSTFGDKIGLAGNLYSMFAPMANTKQAFSQSTPNINPYENYGEEGLNTLQGAKGILDQNRARALKSLMLSKNAATKRGRSSARGVNQMRALDLAANMQGDLATNDLNANFDQQMMQLLLQEAGMENQQDQIVMGGEGARDLADRQDLANYFTQLGRDKATLGEGLQETGKDINTTKQNQVIMNLLNQLSKYGITVDSEGQLSVKTNKDGE